MTENEIHRDPQGIVPLFVDRMFHDESGGTRYCEMRDFEIYRQPNKEGTFVATTLLYPDNYPAVRARISELEDIPDHLLRVQGKYHGPSRIVDDEVIGTFVAHDVCDPDIRLPYAFCIVSTEFQSKGSKTCDATYSENEYCLNVSLQTIYVMAARRGQKLSFALFTCVTEWLMDGLYAAQKALERKDVSVVVDVHIHAGIELYKSEVFVERSSKGFEEWRDLFQQDSDSNGWAHLRIGEITSDFDSDS